MAGQPKTLLRRAQRAEQAVRRDATHSAEAKAMVADLMALPPYIRRDIIASLCERDLAVLLAASAAATGAPFGLYADDAEGFIGHVLGESMWSKSREIMQSVVTNGRTAIPSCFSSSKTWTVSRLVIWWALVHPPGTAKAVTIAPLWRQVIRQVWPEIRSAHHRAGLPGSADMAQLKLTNSKGLDIVAAYGIAANPNQEAAVQGIHASHLLLVVDEAGGIGHTIGRNLRALLTGSHTRMVAIGNPPTDNEGSWFEDLCGSENVETIPISALDTPNFTGELVGRCYSCALEAPEHTIAEHLVDREWYDETVQEYGADSPYVTAKAHAGFPKGGSSRAIPSSWVTGAYEMDEPEGDGWVRLDALDLATETAEWLVQPGSWVRLGVDVAADGGDEMVVARCVGNLVTVEHTSSGAENSNAIDVAGKILTEIRRAQALADRLGTLAPVRVKIDSIGVGWGVASALEAWGSEGVHRAEIVRVNVAESTNRMSDGSSMVPWRKRDEMWLTGRALMQPSSATGEPAIRLRVDKKRTCAQLSNPMYGTTSGGFTQIESKKSMKRRGLSSPDRAEAILLSAYEPAPEPPKQKQMRLVTLGGEAVE